ncbi:putative helicase SNF2 family protein [Streptomyces scabiei 87.22]|uniref:Putative helicase SNF2 family protein n=1 Tax=Streptomyces scabiei (strain 87.22) TaxID=680198 RepID=C9ZFV2_STRSW|nr:MULTISPECIES: DEAD/DEAH box helicase [Streptomyces]MBP5866964.1 DEAD/DEAH box helicase [Streptomyces sp. LBUM 1485]MBP5894066.1 DEAD/DEAH box helicase [Streptomyces sp. LBUM 1481]MBP5917270.1 DEAD/DEAH box helicase [Streptomyces sp. LBUM 1486]MBP5924323.1 DEAD/DEAH box helicase [Streptomyces sp. LBUM 1483]MDX2577944.1 DEAD/DEAH box helicase [Streptomyces scabiei]
MTAVQTSAEQSGATAGQDRKRDHDQYPAGAQVVVRDEVWLVRSSMPTAEDGTRIEVVGVSEFVRDQEAVFFSGLDRIELLDPRATALVMDDSPNYRRSRLFLEAVLRRTALPQSERRLALADSFLMDPLPYQRRPAELALSGANLRPRLLIADVVGLGKTLEIGLTLAELIRRGRGERILVVTPQHVLEQFQHELWTRFAIPLVRLDSVGIERIQREIPAGRNPFTSFKRVIVSIDTLKNTDQYRHHLEQIRWDAVVIDESHNLINRGSLRNQLARTLAPRTDALILASATPHNGDAKSFAELIGLLDPVAIRDPENYRAADIEHLFIRRTKISPEVREQMKGQWADRGPSHSVHCPAGPAEEKIFEELAAVWLPADGGTSVCSVPLFPYTLLKSFLSSHAALRATVSARIRTLEKKNEPRGTAAELAALYRLSELAADLTEADSAKFAALVRQLREEIGVGPGSDQRVVVFSERVQTLEWLAQVLPAALGFKGRAARDCVRVMHGGLSDEQQMACVEEFGLADTPVRVLLTGDVASEGVNLHRQCHQLVHYDVPWSLIRIEQRNGRIDRYGQARPPEFRALILTSEVEGAKDDTVVAERLLEREDQAHRSLGTAEAVTGLYRAEAEEKSLIQDLLRGRTVDESLDARRSDADGEDAGLDDFLADFFGPVGEEAPPAEATESADSVPTGTSGTGASAGRTGASPVLPRLFDSTAHFLDDALREVYPDARERLDLDRDQQSGLLSFRPPTELVHRLKALPMDYLREQRLRERMLVTFNRRLAEHSLQRARESSTSSWPEISLLTDLHPVVEWLTDKVLVGMGRQEAPMITANVAEPVYLVQGVYSNKLGRPTVVKWMGVTWRKTSREGLVDDDMVSLLRRCGVGPTMANKLRFRDPAPLCEALPHVLDTAEAFLNTHRDAWDEPLREPIEQYKRRLGTWRQPTLAGERTKERLADLADSLLTTGRPLLRVLAVLVPDPDRKDGDDGPPLVSLTAPAASASRF